MEEGSCSRGQGVAGSGVGVLSAELWAVGLSLLAVAWRERLCLSFS